MPRTCSICRHPRKGDINQALVDGGTYRSISKEFDVSPPALLRHKKDHLPASLVRAREAREAASADALLADVCKLKRQAGRILRQSQRDGDRRTSLAAIRELRGVIELLGKLAGELREVPTVNVLVSSQYLELRQTITTTLAPYPEARAAAARALKDLPDAE
jgi:hypothetical protein